MKISTFLSTLVFLFCFAAQSQAGKASSNQSISVMKPGEGLGNIQLGESINDVIKKMNDKPDGGKTVKIDSTTEYWLSYLDLGLTFIFNKAKILTRIAVKNPAIIVQQNGLRVNSTRTDIEQVYGTGEQMPLDDACDQIVYREKGLSFTLDRKTEKVQAVTIQSRAGR